MFDINDINYHVYEKDKSKPLTKVNHYMEYPCKVCGDFEFSPIVGHVTEDQLEKLNK